MAWLRLPPQARDGQGGGAADGRASLLGGQREPQARCGLTSFCEFHARHGVELAGLLVTMQPGRRGAASATSYKPFLHHVDARAGPSGVGRSS